MLSTPHDTLFRALVSSDRRAAALLADFLPDSVSSQLDPSFAPERMEGSFVDGKGRKAQCDALFRLRLLSDPGARVYVLLEHKSYPDPATPRQLLRYIVNIWESERDGARSASDRLPLVVSLVFYHGTNRWTAASSTQDMVEAPPGLDEFAPDFRYVLCDLGKADPVRLSRNREVRAALVALVLPSATEIRLEILDLVTEGTIDGSEFASHIYTYVVETTDIGEEMLAASLRRTKPGSWEAIMVTLAETWLKRGRAEGKEVGRAEGKEVGRAEGKEVGRAEGKIEGEIEGRAAVLLELLEQRFGELPSTVRQRVRRANVAELKSWARTLLDAASLDEVLSAASKR